MTDQQLLLINCKTYTDNPSALVSKVARAIINVQAQRARNHQPPLTIALAVPATELSLVKGVPVYAQHVDACPPGAHTGAITAQMLTSHHVRGSLLNHSEKPVSDEELSKTISRAKNLGLSIVACARDDQAAKRIAGYQPSYVAMEPPALIGGDISVSTANPELIKRTVELVKTTSDVPVLVGAGIKNASDVRVALKLGAVGVLVASGVVLNEDIEAAITDLAEGFSS